MGKQLDNSFIDKLLEAPQKEPSRSRKATSYEKAESRTHTSWFALETRLSVCSNAECTDVRPLRTEDGNAMCANVGTLTMCRVCFLDGYGVIA